MKKLLKAIGYAIGWVGTVALLGVMLFAAYDWADSIWGTHGPAGVTLGLIFVVVTTMIYANLED